jgi:AP endonuclease 2
VLLTRGLIPWFKFGDIQPTIKGSDHCPIYVELHDEITSSITGERMRLFEQSYFDKVNVSPRLCAKNWPEFTKAQKLLSTFFGKKGVETERTTLMLPDKQFQSLEDDEGKILSTTSSLPPSSSQPVINPDISTDAKAGFKRKRGSQEIPKSSKSPILRSSSSRSKSHLGQPSIVRFFRADNGIARTSSRKSLKTGSITISQQSDPPSSQPTEILSSSEEPDLEADFKLARELADDAEEILPTTNPEHKKSWSKFFIKHEPPKCTVHGEPCKELITTKPGPNKGKYFWICSRFVLLITM